MMIYVTFAMRRTGQHAIINWLAYQMAKPVLHFNDCRNSPSGIIPDKPGMVMFYNGNGQKINFYNNYDDYKAFIPPEETNCIYSFEEASPDIFDELLTLFPRENVKPIIITRDPYNWAAACLQRQVQFPNKNIMIAEEISRRIQEYKKYLSIALNYENGKEKTIISLSYNHWNNSKEYRDNICRKFGFRNLDIGREEIEYFGHGSTFDERKFDGRASKMKVSCRWENFSDDPNYWSLFDEDIKFLSDELFSFVPNPDQ
jgi:hypothetical protein